jgi:hypothetical protein
VRLYRSPDKEQIGWRAVIEKVGFDLDELVTGKHKLRVA